MPFGSAIATQLLNSILKGSAFTAPTATLVSLHTGSPGATGANEVTGGSYVKGTATWNTPTTSAAGAGTCTLSAAVDFTDMPASTVSWFAVWTQATVFINGGSLTASQVISAGATARLGTATTFSIS